MQLNIKHADGSITINITEAEARERFPFSAEIEINRQGFMAGAGGGSVLNLSLYNTTITRPNGAGSLLSINSNAARLTTSGVTLPAGTTLNDLVLGVVRDANSVPRNLLCNSVI